MSADFEVLIKNAVDAVAGISTMERTPDTFTKAEQDKICVSMKNVSECVGCSPSVVVVSLLTR